MPSFIIHLSYFILFYLQQGELYFSSDDLIKTPFVHLLKDKNLSETKILVFNHIGVLIGTIFISVLISWLLQAPFHSWTFGISLFLADRVIRAERNCRSNLGGRDFCQSTNITGLTLSVNAAVPAITRPSRRSGLAPVARPRRRPALGPPSVEDPIEHCCYDFRAVNQITLISPSLGFPSSRRSL